MLTRPKSWPKKRAANYIAGPANPFLEGNQGQVRANLQNLPGLTSRTSLLPTVSTFAAAARGRQQQEDAPATASAPSADSQDQADFLGTYEEQVNKYSIISGTPKTVLPKIKHVLETLRPGSIFFWDGDGAMNHEDSMRSLRLFGEEVIPAVREMGKELDLKGPFEVDTKTNEAL